MSFKNNIILFILILSTYNLIAKPSISAGPMQGHTTSSSFKIWLMAHRTETVDFILKENNQLVEKIQIETEKKFCHAKHCSIATEFKNLSPNTNYTLTIVLSKRKKTTQEVFNFKTFEKDTTRDFSFITGSCAFIGTGLTKLFNSRKADNNIFYRMSETKGDFMLWLGDNLYYAWEYRLRRAMLKKNVRVRKKKYINDFIQSKPQYAIWDDHEYGPNNSDGTFKKKHHALAMFQSFWQNPNRTVKEDGIYTNFSYSGADFFLLDNRYHSTPKDADTVAMLGKNQMEWLKSQLLNAKGDFKFLVVGSQTLNEVTYGDTWAKFPTERQALFDFIKDNKIEGVVFLCGDRHFSEILRFQPKGLYPLYDLTISPLTSWPNPWGAKDNPNRLEGTHIVEHNYGQISITGERGKRVCSILLLDKNGKEIWTRHIKFEELKF